MSDTLQAVQEMLTVDPDKVILPETAVEGLSAPQISVMKETVAAVQTSFAVAGAALLLRTTTTVGRRVDTW